MTIPAKIVHAAQKRERDETPASVFIPEEEAAVDAKHVRRETFKLDPDTLECPICSETFSPPVYQCENGHSACASCCSKLIKGCGGCPTCTRPIGRIRNLAVEKIVESLQVPCKYSQYGCLEMLMYTKREGHPHIALCEFQPLRCPVGACSLDVLKQDMPSHLTRKHQLLILPLPSPTRSLNFRMAVSGTFVMVTAQEAWLLVYLGLDKTLGEYFYCNSLWAVKKVVYSLKAKRVDVQSESNMVFSMQGVALDRNRINSWKYDYLVVPTMTVLKDTMKEFENRSSLGTVALVNTGSKESCRRHDYYVSAIVAMTDHLASSCVQPRRHSRLVAKSFEGADGHNDYSAVLWRWTAYFKAQTRDILVWKLPQNDGIAQESRKLW